MPSSGGYIDHATFRDTFNQILHSTLDTYIANTSHLTTQSNIHRLFDHLHQYASGGKRLRSYMAYTMYYIYGGNRSSDTFMHLLVCIEIFHIYLIMQDDVIDESTTRHSVATYHMYIHECEPEKSLHYAQSQTYIICDLLYGWCMDILHRHRPDFPSHAFDRAHGSFLATMNEVGIGQMLDVYHMKSTQASYEEIMEKTFWKTATYSFIRPMLFGYYLTGNDNSIDSTFLHTLGKHRGRAYQLRDDLADVIEHDDKKTPFGDLVEGGQTIFTHHIMKHGTNEQRTLLQQLMGKKLSESDKEQWRLLVHNLDLFTIGKDAVAGDLSAIGSVYKSYCNTYEKHNDHILFNKMMMDTFICTVSNIIGTLGPYTLYDIASDIE